MSESTLDEPRRSSPRIPLATPDHELPRIAANPLRRAFDKRTPVMPWRDKRPVPDAEVATVWKRLVETPLSAGPCLAYVHVPFCANHCLFCGFYRNRYHRDDSVRYVQGVIDELCREADASQWQDGDVQAVYLGGGTPSALETPDLVRLITALRQELPLAPDAEFTVEGRILHFDDEKVDACLDAGVNRLSIGVQSFDTRVRQQQGRRATGEAAARYIESLVARDRAAVVIDLMYGLPGQSEAVWQQDLETSLALAPDGLDVYCLSMFPGTPLHKAVGNGRVVPPASLECRAEMYGMASERLAAAGWQQISNSHWAATPRERNAYNRLIKTGATTLAFGSGAGGKRGSYSYTLDGDLEGYLSTVNRGRKPLAGMLQGDALQPLRDVVCGDLEVGALDLQRLPAVMSAAADALPELRQLVDVWQRAGLAERHGDRVTLTTAGRFWSANLIAGFNQRLACVPVASSDVASP